MANLLENLNRRYEKKSIAQEKELDNNFDRFARYKEYQQNGTTIELSFDVALENGDLIYVDENDIHFILTAEAMREGFPAYEPGMKDAILRTPIIVKVGDIKNNTVYLKNAKDRTGINSYQGAVNSALGRSLKKGEKTEVKGTVREVHPTHVVLDIFGTGIPGIITTKYWRREYTRDLSSMVNVGDILSAYVVQREFKRVPKGTVGWLLSRIDFAVDPWDALPDFIQNGVDINVECLDIPQGKSYFWGRCDAIKGIEIMTDLGSGRKFKVVKGGTYSCKIFRLDKEKKRLQATPFADVSEKYNKALKPVVKKEKGSN